MDRDTSTVCEHACAREHQDEEEPLRKGAIIGLGLVPLPLEDGLLNAAAIICPGEEGWREGEALPF